MSYTRDDAERLDFSDIADEGAPLLEPLHPGKVLNAEFLEPLGMTQYRLAKSIGVSGRRIGEIIAGQRGVTADTALRLARLFGLRAEFWMDLQARYDLAMTKPALAAALGGIAPLSVMKGRYDERTAR